VPFNAAVNKFVLASLDIPAASVAKVQPLKAYEQMDMALEDAPVWKEPLVVTDVPVEVMKSVEVVEQTEPAVVVTSLASVASAQPLIVQPPSLWAWLKRQLLRAAKR
jgi:hypothetical protein